MDSPQVHTLEAHFTAADRAKNEYPLLPFDVPPGIARLEVHYQVSDQVNSARVDLEEGNIVGIGLFDPRGSDFLRGEGFRGWSGDARDHFFVAPEQATPGYLPGPLPAGTWHILLGLYQLSPQGCRVRVTVTMHPGPTISPTPPQPYQPGVLRQEARWYRGDLHTHTHHSDATGSLADLVAVARAQGLDFLAITEHNTSSHLRELGHHAGPDLLLIPGQEITTFHGHANAWGITGWQEFRCWTREQMQAVREAVRQSGALFSINHPKEDGPEWEYQDYMEADCVEVWCGPWFLSNYQALAYWDQLLRQGLRPTAVGGSDRHVPPFTGHPDWYDVGTPTTWVYAPELSIPGVLQAIRAGHVFISQAPNGPRIYLEADADGDGVYEIMMGNQVQLPAGATLPLRCRVQGADGSLLRLVTDKETQQMPIAGDDFTHQWEVMGEDYLYVRAEVIEPPEVNLEEVPEALMMKAMTNPIYFTPGLRAGRG